MNEERAAIESDFVFEKSALRRAGSASSIFVICSSVARAEEES